MHIAIHHRPGSFSDKWIEYCDQHKVPYKLVDCYASDIIDQVKDCDGLMWHWAHSDIKAQLFARQLIASIESMGKVTFPSSASCWHYDDKLGQKYLLEAVGAPLVPSYVFYDRREALKWCVTTTYPKVFKLRKGAGASNVRLIKSQKECTQTINTAFKKGFNPYINFQGISSAAKSKRNELFNINNIKNYFKKIQERYRSEKEKYYVFFQDYMANNDFDTRVTVIGNKAFCFRRFNRDNDFRASGSGKISYDQKLIDKRCIEIAFKVTDRINAQSLAFDFLFDKNNEPRIGEISYCYLSSAVYTCPGYWDGMQNFHEGHFYPEDCIIEDLLSAD